MLAPNGADWHVRRMLSIRTILGGLVGVFLTSSALAQSAPVVLERTAFVEPETVTRPRARDPYLPAARWDDVEGSALWTRVTMAAIASNAPELISVVPRDIAQWCPAYVDNSAPQRQAFWMGVMSSLAWYESTHRPTAVGGGNQWFGLMQIFPPTARNYECRARTGNALRDATENLSCATRIMAITVPRDEAVAVHDGRWRGIAADWGPMTSRRKREAMMQWTRAQNYCTPQSLLSVPRPPERPDRLAQMDGDRISTQNILR